ncbi:hypothetical protein HW511_05045 [Asaia siamensis]|uniref:hypothetical protein n=1 Tax=Asaia siamensis TaxID=110479 RepID=UPI00166E0F4C|nr:hypothetical protein [Asaia siamensis]
MDEKTIPVEGVPIVNASSAHGQNLMRQCVIDLIQLSAGRIGRMMGMAHAEGILEGRAPLTRSLPPGRSSGDNKETNALGGVRLKNTLSAV